MTGKLFGAALAAAWGLTGLSGGPARAQVTVDHQADASSAADAAHQQNRSIRSEADSNRNMTRQQSGQHQSSDGQQSWNDSDGERNQARNRNDSRRERDGRDWQSQIRFGAGTDRGLAIASIEQGTPYYRGGLRQGDVIVAWNGQAIRSEDDFGRWAEYRPGQRIPVIVLRDGRRETAYITYDQDRNSQSTNDSPQAYDSQAFLGVRFDARNRGGAVISDVIQGSPAEQAGLTLGDQIVAINGREVNSGREVTRMVASMQPGDRLDIEFSRRVDNHTQAVLENRQGDVASARFERSANWNRQGGQDDGIAQSSYDEQSPTAAPRENSQGATDRNYERRGGRTLLPRLRNQ